MNHGTPLHRETAIPNSCQGVTRSTKRKQVYPRKFDWDEARRLRSQGLSYAAIGRQLGVSAAAIARVVNEATRARMDATLSSYQKSGTCADCGCKISFNPSHMFGPAKRCRPCWYQYQRGCE